MKINSTYQRKFNTIKAIIIASMCIKVQMIKKIIVTGPNTDIAQSKSGI